MCTPSPSPARASRSLASSLAALALAGASFGQEQLFRTYSVREGLGQSQVDAIHQDARGYLWFGTVGAGAARFDGVAFTPLGQEDGLPGPHVQCFAEDRAGGIWVGKYRGGAAMFVGDGVRHYTSAEGLGDPFVLSILEGRGGVLWFATLGGITRLDPRGTRNFTAADGLPGGAVRSMIEDGEGALWIATNEPGVARFDGEAFARFGAADGLSSDRVSMLAMDRHGSIWAATAEGVSRFDGRRFVDVSDRIGVRGEDVYTIVEDEVGDLWFGVFGGGVVRYGVQGEVDRISRVDGLSTNRVGSLVFGRERDLWIGAEVGVDRLDLRAYRADGRKEFEHLGPEDGFLGIECVHNAAAIDARGDLWFGTSEGLTRLRPGAGHHRAVEPVTHVAALRLFHEDADFTRDSRGVDPGSGLPVGLALPHDQNHLTFEFRGLSYQVPEKIRYRYRLLGFESEWSPVTAVAQANYSNVPPGAYVFEVVAKGAAGTWNAAPTRFGFVIEEPFWSTWWFLLGCVLLGSGASFTLPAWRTRQVVDRRARLALEDKVRDRTRELADANEALCEEIARRELLEEDALKVEKLESLGVLAGGIAHDFNNLLTSIVGNLSLAKELAQPGSELEDHLVSARSPRAATPCRPRGRTSRGRDSRRSCPSPIAWTSCAPRSPPRARRARDPPRGTPEVPGPRARRQRATPSTASAAPCSSTTRRSHASG